MKDVKTQVDTLRVNLPAEDILPELVMGAVYLQVGDRDQCLPVFEDAAKRCPKCEEVAPMLKMCSG